MVGGAASIGPGKRVGRYRIERELGRGGESVVYLATDLHLGKQWAVKAVRSGDADLYGGADPDSLKVSLSEEAELLKKLDHPSLPRIVDILEEDGMLILVMDYVEGDNLASLLKREGPFGEEVVREWMYRLAMVLDYLHGQDPPIIYRDMKPANVIRKPDGSLVLLDLGIAREYKYGREQDTVALGTKGYAPPEQYGGAQTDIRSDIYSLGMTAAELLTGCPPDRDPYLYKTHPFRELNPEITKEFEDILNRCVAYSPQKRYGSCRELMQALRKTASQGRTPPPGERKRPGRKPGGRSTGRKNPGRKETEGKRTKRKRKTTAAVILTGLILAGSLAVWVSGYGRDPSGRAEAPPETAQGEIPPDKVPSGPSQEDPGNETIPETSFSKTDPGEDLREKGKNTDGEELRETGKERTGEASQKAGQEDAGGDLRETGQEGAGENSRETGQEKTGENSHETGQERAGEIREILEECGRKGTMSEEESRVLQKLFAESEPDLTTEKSVYAGLCFDAGLSYLNLYSGDRGSFRSRILRAQPFFEEALRILREGKDSAEPPGEKTETDIPEERVRNYVQLCEFFSLYVFDRDGISEPGQEDCRTALQAVRLYLDETVFSGTGDGPWLRLTLLQSMTELLREYRQNFADTGIPEEEVQQILTDLESRVEEVPVKRERLTELQKDILQSCSEGREEIKRTYENIEKWKEAENAYDMETGKRE